MGPAYCFSFVEFLAHGSVENLPDDQHDQPAYRLGLIFDEIEYLGYFQSQEGVEKVLADMRSAAKAQSTADYNNTSRVVHKTIEQHLPHIRARLRDFIKAMNFSFTFAHYAKEVPPIVECLLKGISPAESYDEGTKTSKPSSVPAIINAGWEVYATRLDKFVELFRTELGRTNVVVNLNELLFHAIESSEVLRVWIKVGR